MLLSDVLMFLRSLLVCFNLFCPALFYLPISPGGYDIIKTDKGKGVCVSIATAYEDVLLETFHLEIDLKPTVKISRHNIPPFIPLSSLAEQNNMQTDMRAFLDTLSQHLNAFAGRKQQLRLVKVPDFTFLLIFHKMSAMVSPRKCWCHHVQVLGGKNICSGF